MTNETLLDDLVSRYEALKEQGRETPPEVLCAEHPELLEGLKARLRALAYMEEFLVSNSGDTPGSRSPFSTDGGQPGREGRPAGLSDGEKYPAVPGYEIEDVLGRGGMGIVYRARDVRLNREVAIKFLRDGGPADPGAAARFRAEAQITGQLQHPGIPAVHELGTLPDGQPFLAMKLVKGQTLAALLHERRDPGERRGHFLAIFEQVCQAVGYAHAHRVIHRDLKPHNVMVGAFGEVQVMDWGLAKVLPASRERERPEADPEELPETVARVTAIETPPGGGSGTQTGQVMGTPAYMAPEQAGGEVRRLDARSDVFGLGAILCQILTGRPPYQGTAANDVRLQAVRGELGDAMARLDACGAEPDLVDLCKRCLAFRQEDRPADGGAVAAAVAGIRAAAEERARRAEQERAEALVREAEQRKRRRVWLGLAASLLVGVIASTVLAVWADRSRRKAEQAAAAEREANQTSNAALDFVENRVFAAARPQRLGGLGPEVSLRQALENALSYVEQSFADQPLIEARLRLTLGSSFSYLGDAELARRQFQRSLDLRKLQLGPDHPGTLTSMHNLAVSYRALGRYADAVDLLKETLALMKPQLGPDHPSTLTSMNGLALCYRDLGRLAYAARLHEETLALQRSKLGSDHPDTLKSIHNLALCYHELGQLADALKLREEVLTVRKFKLGIDHPDTMGSMSEVAVSYDALGQYTNALKLHKETLALKRTHFGSDHPETLLTMNNLANCFASLGRDADALKLREETLALKRAQLGTDHPDTLLTMYNMANSYEDLGRCADALKLREATLPLQQAKLGPDHFYTLATMNNLAISYITLRRTEDATKLLQQALDCWQKQAAQSGNIRAQMYLAWTYGVQGMAKEASLRFGEAAESFSKALEHFNQLDQNGKLTDAYFRGERDRFRQELAICQKAEQVVADLNFALEQPPAEAPGLMNARLRVSLKKKDRAGVAATAEAWQWLAGKDTGECYYAAGAWSLASQLAADEKERGEDAAKALALLKRALEAKKPSPSPLLLAWRLEQDPDFAPLRTQPDFAAFLKELHAAGETQGAVPP